MRIYGGYDFELGMSGVLPLTKLGHDIYNTSYGPCLRHGPVALASSQTQPHFVWLGPCISNSMLNPRPNLTLFG
ncbi:hypothetical protein E4T56_gene6403 [Termitomyces sp. T112]|nr:hypothetical protein E4T56_gene6403 [Termitomyces sp. T112]